jgi:hypothetical protein
MVMAQIPALLLPKKGDNDKKATVKPTPKKVPKNKPQQQNNKKYAALLHL